MSIKNIYIERGYKKGAKIRFCIITRFWVFIGFLKGLFK
mgnify:CR=1 FL=1|jgi:hypothetical protein